MFVLTDIEWVTNPAGHFSPSQIAAIKVDRNWNETDRFESFIRPRDEEFHKWNHVAYTGGTASDFLNAKNAHSVLEAFLAWICPEDIILWWYKESDSVFKKLTYYILKRKFENKTVIINDYVYAFLSERKKHGGNMYKIADSMGIRTNPQLKHCSVNDAAVMQMLLKKLEFPQENLLSSPTVPEKPDSAGIRLCEMPYQYDCNSNTIHIKDCPVLLAGNVKTQGFETWKTALRKGYKPCLCCKSEYRSQLKTRNADTVKRSQYTYIYSENSQVFHKYSCGVMLYAKSILGTRKYETVIGTGRKPCKLCRPTEWDEYRPLPPRSDSVSSEYEWLKNKTVKKLPMNSAKAIIRHKTAYEERQNKLKDDTLTVQEKRDIYTLTQPRFAFWAGRGYQAFHLHTCPKLQKLKNLRGFSAYSEAVCSGYTPCRKCRPTPKHDMKLSVPINSRVRKGEKAEDIESLCDNAGWVHYREEERLYLETPVGKWYINTSGSPISLYHINLVMTPKNQVYHVQPRLFLSLADTFEYIKRHDAKLEKDVSEGKVFFRLAE